MPENDDHDSPDERRREPKISNNFFSKAKRFFLKKPKINAIGRDANFLEQRFNARYQFNLFVGPSQSDQHGRQIVRAAQDSHGSRDEAAQTTLRLVQEPSMQLQTTNNNFSLPFDSDNTSEPEATAIYADPVPLDSMTVCSQTSRSRLHIYHLEMLMHRAGYPLYMPTPPEGLPASHRENGIRVGDVGVITANGAFHFLFNAFQHHSQSDAEICPPIDCSTLLKSKILTSKKFGPKTYLSSIFVNDTGDPDMSPTFQCSSDAGAILALPKGAVIYEAGNRVNFQTHASRHALRWYEHVLNDGVDISNGSLYFVTECTKSVDWGIAVFYARSEDNHNLRLIFDGESYQWECRGKIDARIGSQSTDTTVPDRGEPNQCVFLGGYKIMLRQDIWDKLKSAITVASQDGRDSSPEISHSANYWTSASQTDPFNQSPSNNLNAPESGYRRCQGNQLTHTMQVLQGGSAKTADTTGELGRLILDESFGDIAPLHPSDRINVMLLHLKPDATVALTHDSEWCDNLPDDFNADPLAPNFDGLLKNIKCSYKAVIDEHGSVSLSSEVQVTSPVTPADTLVPTRDRDYPRFRILVVGQSGAGKSSLINAVFKASMDGQHIQAGKANNNEGIISPHNKHLILHDSVLGNVDKFKAPEEFITEKAPAERLHAIWFCTPASYSRGRLFRKGEEEIFELHRNKVPIIVVVTKFDLYIADMQRRAGMKNKISYKSAEDDFRKEFGHTFDKNSASQGQIRYALVSKTQVGTYQRLVQITRESIRIETPGPLSGHGRGSDEDLSCSYSAQIALETAQRVDMAGKIEASIKLAKMKYWRAIGTGIRPFCMSLEQSLKVIRKDIITIWNIRDLHDYFLGDAFHRQMMVIVEDLIEDATKTVQNKIAMTSTMAGPSKLWTSGVFKEGPSDIRCLMGYVVDLTLILQCIFKVSLQDQFEGKVSPDNIDEIIYQFHCSEKKQRIHDAIRKSIETRYPFTKRDLENEIASLIEREKCNGS